MSGHQQHPYLSEALPDPNLDDEGANPPAGASSAVSDGDLPRIIAAAAAVLKASRARLDSVGAGAWAGVEEGTEAGATVAVGRLEKTLQQVAVHRVQQIYARLNGAAVLEERVVAAATAGASTGAAGNGSVEMTSAEPTSGVIVTAEAGDEGERLEREARSLVAFACGACALPSGGADGGSCGGGGGGRGGGTGGGGARRLVTTWGDEDERARGRASWSMMMPYLPVWVGFAAAEQVGRWWVAGGGWDGTGRDPRARSFFAVVRLSRS